jgi:hypothetical protein
MTIRLLLVLVVRVVSIKKPVTVDKEGEEKRENNNSQPNSAGHRGGGGEKPRLIVPSIE